MPPLAFVALLALYWSTQVCMRPLPAVSDAYFGETAFGKTAGPDAVAAGAAVGLAAADAAGLAAALAALYLALHSVIDSALAGLAADTLIKPIAAMAKSNFD